MQRSWTAVRVGIPVLVAMAALPLIQLGDASRAGAVSSPPAATVITRCTYTILQAVLKSGSHSVRFALATTSACTLKPPATIVIRKGQSITIDGTDDVGSVKQQVILNGQGRIQLFDVKTGASLTLFNVSLRHGFVTGKAGKAATPLKPTTTAQFRQRSGTAGSAGVAGQPNGSAGGTGLPGTSGAAGSPATKTTKGTKPNKTKGTTTKGTTTKGTKTTKTTTTTKTTVTPGTSKTTATTKTSKKTKPVTRHTVSGGGALRVESGAKAALVGDTFLTNAAAGTNGGNGAAGGRGGDGGDGGDGLGRAPDRQYKRRQRRRRWRGRVRRRRR